MDRVIEVVEVRSDLHARVVRELAGEFVGWLRDRYPDMQVEIDEYLASQNYRDDLDDRRAHLHPDANSPPRRRQTRGCDIGHHRHRDRHRV